MSMKAPPLRKLKRSASNGGAFSRSDGALLGRRGPERDSHGSTEHKPQSTRPGAELKGEGNGRRLSKGRSVRLKPPSGECGLALSKVYDVSVPSTGVSFRKVVLRNPFARSATLALALSQPTESHSFFETTVLSESLQMPEGGESEVWLRFTPLSEDAAVSGAVRERVCVLVRDADSTVVGTLEFLVSSATSAQHARRERPAAASK